jgi:YHS domain-containing protein
MNWRALPGRNFGFTPERIQRAFLAAALAAALALGVATLRGGPRPVAAQEEGFRIGLPAYVEGDPIMNARVMYADSSISINTTCPVRGGRVDPAREPVYVNGRPVAFCCHPCPSVFSRDPERYLREIKAKLSCPVRPAQKAIFDSSLRATINQDIFFFSSVKALKQFRKDPFRYCGILTDPVSRARFRPTKESPHVTFRGREYYFAADSSLARFQSEPERFFERLAGS